MYKKCKIVMLPTNKKSKLVLSFKEKSFNQLVEPKLSLIQEEANYQFSNIQSQHLYIISDEEIKEGDWRLDIRDGNVYKSNKADSELYDNTFRKKIIATTDFTLEIDHPFDDKGDLDFPLPGFSQSCIEYFVKQYNKGNIITEVDVKYGYTINKSEGPFNRSREYFLKIDDDNNIIIKPIKESWDKDEVYNMANKVREYLKDGWKNDTINRVFYDFDRWFEENL
jgi:hypothetical protein